MTAASLDIGNEFGRGWKLFQTDIGLLITVGAIGAVLSLVTCGVLAGPMMAGLFMIIRRLQKNDPTKPAAGDIFKGFDHFAQSFLFVFLLILACVLVGMIARMIPFLGQPLSMAISLFVGSIIMWGITFIVYQQMNAIDALKKLVDGTISGAFVMPLVFGLLANLLSTAGTVACLVGVFFTCPLACCCMVSAYETLFDGSNPATAAPETPPAAGGNV